MSGSQYRSFVFEQTPAFGGFGSSTTSPFGSTDQESQPAFGSSLFCLATPFGAASQSGFGATSTPAFGTTSTPAFSSKSTPSFGAASTPAFGSTAGPAFGSTGSAIGVSNAPDFGTRASSRASNTSLFASSSPACGAASSPVFGAASSPAFAVPNTPIFGGSSCPPFIIAPTSAFGQSTSAFGNSLFGARSSAIGSQAPAPKFGSSGFGQPHFGAEKGGSPTVPYTTTDDTESTGAWGQPWKLESISAMPAYKEKSHEELRWGDYQLGDKGELVPFFQPSSSPSWPTSTLNSSLFGTSTTNPFQSISFPSTATSGVGTTSPSLFGTSSISTIGSTPSLFTSTASAFNPSICFASSSSPLFQSITPSLRQTGSIFPQTASSIGPSSASPFGQSNIMFNTLATSQSGGLFPNTSSLFPSTNTGGFGPTTASTASPFQLRQSSFIFVMAPAAGTSGFGFGYTGASGQNIFPPQPFAQNYLGVLQVPVANPFGTLPEMPQISIAGPGITPTFGSSSFSETQCGELKCGSRAVPCTKTAVDDAESTNAGGQPRKLESISTIPAGKEKSDGELKWEDYQSGDEGEPLLSGQPSAGTGCVLLQLLRSFCSCFGV